MSQAYRYSNTLAYSFEQLTAMHNESFRGYYVPVPMTPDMTAEFWRTNHIDARLCVVMHTQGGDYVGMARVGMRGKRAWCGGFAIVPAHRGTGASRLLAERMIAAAREAGMTSLWLEVLAQNERARRLYARVGFQVERRLTGFEIATPQLRAFAGSQAREVEAVEVAALVPGLVGTERAAWNRELASILALPARALALRGAGEPRRGVVYKQAEGKVQVLGAALPEDISASACAGLLAAATTAGATYLQVYNEPNTTRLHALCEQIGGFRRVYEQDEMVCPLA